MTASKPNGDDQVQSHKETKDEKEVAEYWTEEKIRKAQPIPMPSPKQPNTSDGPQVEPDHETPIMEDEAE